MKLEFNITGRIKAINPPQTRGNYTWSEAIIVTDGEYPQMFCFQFSGVRIDLPQPFQPGQVVEVKSNPRGREWTKDDGTTSYFVTFAGWSIQHVQANAPAPGWGAPQQPQGGWGQPQQPQPQQPQQPQQHPQQQSSNNDDLPF